ncbi:N-acetylmuramic acid 6-phosphate etherase [Cellulomonas citrea]|uniref:N-acetylmuramic acid 6-phosphate etherase n=1 Tax=Cellulomonas citrea TaxID=1909423 RepID=UPI001357606F|nr:N-acetylmuramic acid 6-phosphate etherase [Cellulomonas citrea]
MTTDEDLSALATEAPDPRFAQIDRMSVAELAALMNETDHQVPQAVQAALPQIVPAIEAASRAMADGGRLVYVGAGTPGRIGVLDASECPPTFSTPPELVVAVIAGGPAAIANAVEGAEDDEDAGAQAMDEVGIGPKDTVVGIASSGRTPYVVAAVRRARELGAVTLGLSCTEHSVLSAAVDHPIEVVVGPELVTGSTRLKAGTAQKLVLNMISTIAMVQLGKTYGSLMVDLHPTNHKLRERAVRMVRTIADVDDGAAREALAASDFDVKTAAVALRLGLPVEPARARLAATGGRLRHALEED